jgi:D-ribose pyranose/furanose isomerase RbsD
MLLIMKKILQTFASLVLVFIFIVLPLRAQDADWRAKLQQELPLLGHRNWIMIVDSAYPLQVSPGVETIETGSTQLQVTRDVLEILDHSIHVTPDVFLDAELPYVTDQLAPGVGVYREHLQDLLRNRPVKSLPHETLINQINQAGQTFHVLVLKTTMTIPYSSVFLQLDCKYWPPAAEQQLRQSMRNGHP